MIKKSRFNGIHMLTLIPPTIMMLISLSGFAQKAYLSGQECPCDIYAAAGNPCVAAHSSTRALYASYKGALYQVMRQSDGKTLDIGTVRPTGEDPGGYADAAAQDAFCSGTLCWITTIYDQSGKGNHLVQAPPGTFKGPAKGGFNTLPIADMAPVTIMGHKVYGVYIMPGMGLRNNNATGLAINDEPEGIYMVCDGKHFDSGCCFNYGNTSTNSRAVGRGTMETVYFGTSTAWGRGNGTGPWIMSDMEAGLFSGYNAKQNLANPTIDSWNFVTGVVNGGDGNKWQIRGGDAQNGNLSTFYNGIRPHSPDNNFYYPMHRKGAVQMGNGGDNGNGSAGTFYEGVMTGGYPSDATTDAVQTNIVAARYDIQRLDLSRIASFYPGSEQSVTATFTNITEAPVTGVKISISVPKGWKSTVADSKESVKIFRDPVAPGESVTASFAVTSPAITGTFFLNGKAEWKYQASGLIDSETTSKRVRNVYPVKINEVRFEISGSPTNQFIELYNSGSSETDLSGWTLISAQSMWAPVKLGKITAGTKLAAQGFFLLGLSPSGLAAPANRGENIINVRSTTGFEAGHQIDIEGEIRTIASVGTAATPITTIFVPVSTGPWIIIPAGSTNLPVTIATGFEVGQKIGIDLGGNYEVATVTVVGKGATQTILSQAANTGDTIIKVAACANITNGDILTLNTGSRKELVRVKRILNVVTAPSLRPEQPGYSTSSPGDVVLTAPLKSDHMLNVDVSSPGTGISFFPATRFVHKSGDAVQALGSGITLKNALEMNHEVGAAVLNPMVTSMGYQGAVTPNQWYGAPISTSAGSVTLLDASGEVVVDAIVYGSQQSNSSANGIITTPEISILEGNQSQGGCIVIAPGTTSGSGPFATFASKTNKSAGRFPDGTDTDSNCNDFFFQGTTILTFPAPAGTNNIKVTGIADFSIGQKVIIGSGEDSETRVVSNIGTPGGTTLGSATSPGTKVFAVASSEGFSTGQTITVDEGKNTETAIISSVTVARRRFGASTVNTPMDSIAVSTPLTIAHTPGIQVSGSGITFTSPLERAHDKGTQVASNIPTPGRPNLYVIKP